MIEQFIAEYFGTGLGWAAAGAMLAVLFGCVGSAMGIRIAGTQAAGVLAEKPELFGKLLVLMALPGTQGFYGFICAIFIASQTGLLGGEVTVTPVSGLGLLFVGIGMGIANWRGSIYQGRAAAASINLVSRRPEEAGRSILIPALVETYSVVALLSAILFIMWLTADGMTVANVFNG